MFMDFSSLSAWEAYFEFDFRDKLPNLVKDKESIPDVCFGFFLN
jgi:hypothetical protein